jgi:hypothetical protein
MQLHSDIVGITRSSLRCLVICLAAIGLLSQRLASADNYLSILLSDQPVALYRFEEADGAIAANSAPGVEDAAASADGAYIGQRPSVMGALAADTTASNRAARFDGTSSLITVQANPDVLDITGAISLEMWIRPLAGGESTQCIVAKGDFAPNNGDNSWYVVYFAKPAGGGRIRFGVGGGLARLDQSGEIPADKFTHLVVTFDPHAAGNNTHFYIDGELNRAGRIDVRPTSRSGQRLTIGGLSYDPDKEPFIQHFCGDLDELAIYQHVLEPDRVRVHFEQLPELDHPLQFETDIQPILATHCYQCHEGSEPEGGLDVTSLSALLHGGENGPAIVRGNAAQSILVDMLVHHDMPPDDLEKLSDKQIRWIRRWVDEGALADEQATAPAPRARQQTTQHWAFQPLTMPAVPASAVYQEGEFAASKQDTHSATDAQTPIDAFVLHGLVQHGLSMSSETDRRRLVRRIYFDLTGLPPPPDAVDQFLSDERPDATRRLIDRQLASPHFGIRWGRHWLDIVGYTDTISFDDDFGPPIGFTKGKWLYRDYVVRSWNEDKPYSRFLHEQFAGDEMVDWRNAERYTPEIRDHLVATGFFRCCEDISQEDPRPFIIWSVLHDTVSQIGTSVLGLTLTCARCHSHKFEPVSQQDYYSLMAMVTPALNVPNWKNPEARALPDVSKTTLDEINRHDSVLDQQVAPINEKIAAIKSATEAKLRDAKYATLPETLRDDTKSALARAADERSEIQKYLADKLEALLTVKPDEVDAALSVEDQQQIAEHNQEIAEINTGRRNHGWIMAMYDVGSPPETHLFKRGDYLFPRRAVPPQFLGVLTSDATDQILVSYTGPLAEEAPPAGQVPFVHIQENSGRRTALARWLTDKHSTASGLVARVMMNRVWQHLLGQGIVSTAENMGVSGAAPTHPELIEWLATDFRHGGWSLKRAIRQIMSSAVYRQSSEVRPESISYSVDPENKLLWRARLRRLEAEAIRDAMLSAGGVLDTTLGGAPVPLEYHPDGRVTVAKKGLATPTSGNRRTLYLLNRRIYNPSLLNVFDKPIVTSGVCQREDAAVPLQSLAMMNDGFVAEQAAQLAARVMSVADQTTNSRIESAFRLALSRRPSAIEMQSSHELLAKQAQLFRQEKSTDAKVQRKALTELCQTLMNTNEFLYLE